MKKICNEIEIELTEKEVKLIKDIWDFWIALDDEFNDDDEINCEEFVDFLNDVASDYNYTVLNGETIKITKVKDNDNKNFYKSNTKEEKEFYNRGYDDGYENGYNDGYEIGQNDHPIRPNY